MKTAALTLILALSLCLCSCDEHSYPRTLRMADSLANICPDSALVLLEQLKESIGNEPEETQMYYHLLTIKAKDKAYITHTSDSLITQVLRYYRGKKNKKHLPMAYYYAGRVYSDLGDAPEALEYFHRAIKASERNEDYRLMNKIYSQIGTLYLYQDVYEQAPEMFRKSYHYGKLLKDSIGMVYELRDIGRSFATLDYQDSAIYYYKKADELAESIRNLSLREVVNSELAGYYTNWGMYEEAYQILQRTISVPEKYRNTPPFHAVFANYYHKTHQLDSAEYYYSKLLSVDSYLYKQGGYQGLYHIARAKGETEKAFAFLDQYLAYTDSVLSISRTEAISKASSLYNYQLKQEENQRLKTESFRKKQLNIFLGTVSAFLFIAFIAYREYHKRKEQAKQVQAEKYKKIQEEQYKSSLAQIKKNEQEIEQLETSLQEAIASKNKLHQTLLKAQKECIEKSDLTSTAIYKKFLYVAKEEILKEEDKIKAADWQELACAVDKAYNQFTQRLNELHPIKNIELRVCLLLKIDLSPRQIAAITIRSKQAITSIRKRLYQKFFKKEGTPNQWDNFIQGF